MGIIYAFVSKSKPWVKLGQTVNCPIARIEDYNETHGTDFDPASKSEWYVPDTICLQTEQAVHCALEDKDFDRIRKGSATEIFTYSGRNAEDFLVLVDEAVGRELERLKHDVEYALNLIVGEDAAASILKGEDADRVPGRFLATYVRWELIEAINEDEARRRYAKRHKLTSREAESVQIKPVTKKVVI
jgi:hypothetical protein